MERFSHVPGLCRIHASWTVVRRLVAAAEHLSPAVTGRHPRLCAADVRELPHTDDHRAALFHSIADQGRHGCSAPGDRRAGRGLDDAAIAGVAPRQYWHPYAHPVSGGTVWCLGAALRRPDCDRFRPVARLPERLLLAGGGGGVAAAHLVVQYVGAALTRAAG